MVKLLLDGQQRVTTLYGIIRGKVPKFFDGNASVFTGLRFNLENETFAYYQPMKMQADPLWVDVTKVMQEGNDGLGKFVEMLAKDPALAPKVALCSSRLNRLLGIHEIDLHIDEVTGKDKKIDEVVEIFNRVNSGGTKLSQGDLALAKICSEWPEGRDEMKKSLKVWSNNGYHFNLDWLLRSVNTTLTGEAKFTFLHGKSAQDVQDGLKRAVKRIDTCLNMISGRLGLDHDRVLFGRYAIPIMVRYLDQHDGSLGAVEQDKLLFWFVQAGMWGRFSGSTETVIDQDLAALEVSEGGLDRLLEQFQLSHGALRTDPGHFTGWSLGARFYPVLYMLTRIGGARDWGTTGLPLKSYLLGKMNKLEVHHIFPKAQLYKLKCKRPLVNALANFCFLTKETNLKIGEQLPEKYFPEVEQAFPGALASQWIPMDPVLWKIENFGDFLEARRKLLAAATNTFMSELLHDDTHWMEGTVKTVSPGPTVAIVGEPAPEAEEEELEAVNDWMEEIGLPRGIRGFDLATGPNGAPQIVIDLAWPKGIQEELSEPVAILLNESNETLVLASQAGFRYFTTTQSFKKYVHEEILGADHPETVASGGVFSV
jgi:hypothetical protein